MGNQDEQESAPGVAASQESNPTMKRAAFRLDDKFLDELHARIVEARAEFHASLGQTGRPVSASESAFAEERYSVQSIPSREHLDELVQTSFWASLRKEERQFAQFAVGYAGNTGYPYVLALGELKPFDIRNLVKVAPAIGNLKSAAMVYPDDKGALEIWGVANDNNAPFIVKALDPGQLIVSYAHRNIAVISGEEAVFIKSDLHDRGAAIWSKLGFKDAPSNIAVISDLRVSVLLDTLSTMRSLARGGAIIVVPENGEWRNSISSINYQGRPSYYAMRGLIKEWNELGDERYTEAGMHRSSSIHLELRRQADCLAQLTSVDGATVISRELDLIGFGAKIKYDPKSDNPQIVYKLDPLEGEGAITAKEMHELGGMRHQSAANFVAECQEAIALVVSEDGNVTAFVWNDEAGHVLAFARLELTLF